MAEIGGKVKGLLHFVTLDPVYLDRVCSLYSWCSTLTP